jgi:RNA polymerase sigma-70 factor (ECF subfamily)
VSNLFRRAPFAWIDAGGPPQAHLVAAIPRLRRYARVLIRDPKRADDLVQDTLVRAQDKQRLWQPGSNLRAWLFRIMHDVYVSRGVVAARREAGIITDAEEERGPDRQATEDDHPFARIQLRELEQQLGRLPAEDREVLLLAAVEELRYEEIASILAIPVATVLSRLSRARDNLTFFACVKQETERNGQGVCRTFCSRLDRDVECTQTRAALIGTSA